MHTLSGTLEGQGDYPEQQQISNSLGGAQTKNRQCTYRPHVTRLATQMNEHLEVLTWFRNLRCGTRDF